MSYELLNSAKLENSRMSVTAKVLAEDFENAIEATYKEQSKDIQIKGFRKGAAPRHMIEKIYGPHYFYEGALNYVLNSIVNQLLQDKEYQGKILGNYKVEDEDKLDNLENGFEVTLSFDVAPEFNLPTYKGLKVKAADSTVTSEDVDKAIDNLVRPKAVKQPKEGNVENGDITVIDFEGFVNDVPFDGGKAEKYELRIGSGSFIPGFEDQMVGMEKGQTKDVIVTFPEHYQAEDLAGKEAKFVVTVHEIYTEVLPELTEDFIASLKIADVKNLDELKAYEEKELKSRKETAEKDRITNELINQIIDNAVIDMPEILIQDRVQAFRSQYENQAKMYNIPFETFLQLMGTDKAKFEEETYKQGKRNAIFSEVVSKIVREEKLEPSEEELKAELNLADGQKASFEQYNQAYSKLVYNKFVEFILANAVYTD